MIQDIPLPQIVSRLKTLEETVKAIQDKLEVKPTLPQFEFVISIDNQEIWSGLDLEPSYAEIHKQHPEARLIISWRSSPVVLV